MKKLLTLALIGLMGTTGAQAQDTVDEFGLFDHVSAGLSLGTTGIGIEVAAPLCNFVQARMGYSFMPGIKKTGTESFHSTNNIFKKEVGTGYYDEVEYEGKLTMGDFKLLFDIFPFKNSIFRVTAGAYIGKSKAATVKSTNHFINQKYWGNSGPELGTAPLNTYTVVSADDGHVDVDLKANSFKPYIGIGVGRAVPKHRIGVSADLGVQFWGKPGLYTTISDNTSKSYREVEKSKVTNDEDYCDDIRDVLKVVNKVVVYPVLTIRVNGRIF